MEIIRTVSLVEASLKGKGIRELESRLQENEEAVEESLNEKMGLADTR
jgi:hypothetical protein